SMDIGEKRLAIHVEDHPLEYGSFEGIIPEGQYGAGKVEIWDEGYYTLPGVDSVKECHQQLSEGIEKGDISFELHGHKLKGSFALVKMKGRGDNSWLFFKRHDLKADENSIQDLSEKAPRVKMPHKIKPMLCSLINKP